MIGTVALFQRSNRYFINDRDGGKHLVWERIDRPKIRQVPIRREAPQCQKPRYSRSPVSGKLMLAGVYSAGNASEANLRGFRTSARTTPSYFF